MVFDKEKIEIANNIVAYLQALTETIGDAESVAITVWWVFVNKHAIYNADHDQSIDDPDDLARHQLEEFIKHRPVKIGAVQ